MHTDCVPTPVLHVSIVPTGTLVTSEEVDSKWCHGTLARPVQPHTVVS